ncbi:Galactoside 2-alpha-L-fucosyltransferase 1 [Armadillidium nasatum]|uniref:L-Fucosyltransferase n=1 Tax=Armadillidium nasatum TaxID=96803 RepID=A0A5N5THT6_9CRUS|nr:Galactoside 2-alpha-L-fucosyltransferase 1 [Armadillidium nasatum]
MNIFSYIITSSFKHLKLRRYTFKIKSVTTYRTAFILLFLLLTTIIVFYEYKFSYYVVLRPLGFEACSSGIKNAFEGEIELHTNIESIFHKRRKSCSKYMLSIYKRNDKIMPRNTNHSDCSISYVTMNPKGRLGNQICQYLSLALLKDFFDIRVAIHRKMYDKLSPNFKTSIPVSNSSCFTKDLAKISYKTLYSMLYKEAVNKRTPQDALKVSYHIDDYPCPAEILIQNRQYFKEMLSLHNHTQQKITEYIKDNLRKLQNYENKVLISIHVRRTDYLRHMNILYKRSVLTPCYYINAINFYRKRYDNQVIFLLSSDDLDWCKAFLSFPDVINAGNGTKDEAVYDFFLLSSCNHHIIGLGTFGFLSAFYGNGTIMYPLIDTDKPSELERSYICSNSSILIPMLDNIYS